MEPTPSSPARLPQDPPRTPTKKFSGRRASILDDFDFPPPPSHSRSNSVANQGASPQARGTPPANARPQTARQIPGDSLDAPFARRHSRNQSWSSVTRDSVVENLLMSFDRMGGRMPGQDVAMDRSPTEATFDVTLGPTGLLQRTRNHTSASSVSSSTGSAMGSPAAKREGLAKRLSRASSETVSTLRNASQPRASVTKRAKGSIASTAGQGQSRSGSVASNESAERGRPMPSTFSPFESLPESTATASSRKPSEYGVPAGMSVFSPFDAKESKPASTARKGSELDVPPGVSTFSPFGNQSSDLAVPAGGLRKASVALSPVLSQASSSRKNSPRIPAAAASQTSLVLNSKQSSAKNSPRLDGGSDSPKIPQVVRDQASEFVRASTMRGVSQSPNASPQLDHGAFTTPQRFAKQEYVRTPNQTQKKSSTPADAARDKEKSGFFRRVFKSTNRSSSSQDIQRQDSRDSSAHRADDTPAAKQHAHKPNPALAAPQLRPEPARADSSPVNGVVNKKPSSFFRRRKRSVTETEAPPALPPQLLGTPVKERQEPTSPGAGSLTRALDHYLDTVDQQPSTKPSPQIPMSSFAAAETEGEDEEDDDPDIFHSGYTPPPDASLHRLAPHEHSRNTTPAVTPKPSPMLSQLESDSEDEGLKSNTLKIHVKKQRPQMLSTNSFLHENSDVEGKSKAPSVISAISSTYGLPEESFHSPVSPMSTRELEGGIVTYFTPILSQEGFNSRRTHVTESPRSSFEGEGPDFVVTAPSRRGTNSQMEKRPDRLRLEPTATEEDKEEDDEDVDDQSMSLPVEGIRVPESDTTEAAASAKSEDKSLPIFKLEGNDVRASVDIARSMSSAPSSVNPDEPTSEDKERAKQIYDGDEGFLLKGEAAAWLGERKPASGRALVAYMALFNWSGQNILSAMRSLCGRLVLKGESQQVDRVLDAFAQRWDQCNQNNGFKGTNVVHAICYALLLLNTDHHVADIQHKMTRSEFVKNSMPTIKDAADHTIRPARQDSRPTLPWQDSAASVQSSSAQATDESETMSLTEQKKRNRLSSFRPGLGFRTESDSLGPLDNLVENSASNALVNQPYTGSEKGWLSEMEGVLKSYYTSIVAEALPLMNTEPQWAQGANGLSAPHTLRRTGSVISKAPSESFSYRGWKENSQSNRWYSKGRSRNKGYQSSTASFNDGDSMMSPAGTSMWSKVSMGRTQTTMSTDSFGVYNDFKPSVGFSNALSQAIIREEGHSDGESFTAKIASLLEDESLELYGAPWAKEGMLKHKHHLEGPDRKAKERSWNDVFCVVGKGHVRLFSFKNNSTTKISSMTKSRKIGGKPASIAPSVVGGGNWTDNAEALGTFPLRQTIATTLPAPGYSKSRPHVWALSLPTGAVHLFQVGTGEIAEEFASTANYWSARLSKEPLVGGVDSMEYGWSENILNPALIGPGSIASESTHAPSARGRHQSSGSLSGMTAFTSMGSVSAFSDMPVARHFSVSSAGPAASLIVPNVGVRSRHHSTSGSISGMSSMVPSARHQSSGSLSGMGGIVPPSVMNSSTGGRRPSMQSSLRSSFDQSFGGRPRLPGDKAHISDWQPPAASMLPSQLLEVDQLRSLKAYVCSIEMELDKHGDLRNAISFAYNNRNGGNYVKVMQNWERKSSYLLREVIKFRTYIDALDQAGRAKERVYKEREEWDAAKGV
ncbi:hypothetical protein MBLNU459_g2630t1 [Dothideomycetes sp. NU459]